jgi:hypothetical protein
MRRANPEWKKRNLSLNKQPKTLTMKWVINHFRLPEFWAKISVRSGRQNQLDFRQKLGSTVCGRGKEDLGKTYGIRFESGGPKKLKRPLMPLEISNSRVASSKWPC